MTVTLAIRFPLGRYHATPWDRAVNEGDVEWPPSPWRLLRGLISTWHLRWPELSPDDFDNLLTLLAAAPPRYWTPHVSPGQSRHFMPDLDHQSGDRSTDLVLDPFLWVSDEAPVLVQWDASITTEQRAMLAKLCELWPYLGRSESIVRVELLADDPEPDRNWWEVAHAAARTVTLLSPDDRVSRKELEATTGAVRRSRLGCPLGSVYLPYARATEPHQSRELAVEPVVHAVRWQLTTSAPFMDRYGVLATEELRRTRLKLAEIAGPLRSTLSGKQSHEANGDDEAATDGHGHAHWLWLPAGERVADLVLWAPEGFASSTAGAMVSRSSLPGFRGWNPDGFRPGEVHMTAIGSIESVAPDLVGPSVTWNTRTPYLPVRHQKRRQSVQDWIANDLAKECEYRNLPRPVAVTVHADRADHVRRHRRYRWSEKMSQRRAGCWVSLVFDKPVQGPMCLGQLSHFGFGLLVPAADEA